MSVGLTLIASLGTIPLAKPHFVDAYERLVAHLLIAKPLDEAMSLAVGGSYERFGEIEADILHFFGLQDGMSVVDLGCGSGRLAHALGRRMQIGYLGIDIVQEMLDYATSKSPSNYRFVLSHALRIPEADNFANFAAAFSVFTHLLPSESYLYLEDFKRVLKPGGKLIFSFLEFAESKHWQPFMDEVNRQRSSSIGHLNTMIERSVVEIWCKHLGYALEAIIGAGEAPWGTMPLGQTVAVLCKND
jgi:SAM-dependent methyltransferase